MPLKFLLSKQLRFLTLLPVIIASAQQASTQTAQDWQTKAGGRLQFEVASVRLDQGPFKPPSFALSADDSYPANAGNLFHADFPVQVYIDFAYKLGSGQGLSEAMLATLPQWVRTERYEVVARAPGSPTKDQVRLMMQSLLAERFGLRLHFEKQETPVYAMELIKSGKLGPKLHPHSEGLPCDKTPPPAPKGAVPETFPYACDMYVMMSLSNHDALMGSRNTTAALIANAIPTLGSLGRPVIDRTGLTGRYDFTVEFSPPQRLGSPSRAADAPSPPGGTFLEAAEQQLGIKLVATKALLDVPVIDHIERPSAN